MLRVGRWITLPAMRCSGVFLALVLGCSQSMVGDADGGVDGGPPVCGAADPCEEGPPLAVPLRLRPADVLANQIGDSIARIVRWEEAEAGGSVGPFAQPFPTAPLVSARLDALSAIATDEAERIVSECADSVCIDDRVAALVAATFARPLPLDELGSLTESLGGRTATEVEAAILQAFLSPDAWLVREVGSPLSAGDRARRAAAAFWRSGPDAALLRAFASGESSDRIVTRLSSDARASRGFERFHDRLLGPSLGEGELAERMAEETDAYLESVVSSPEASYSDWIAAPYTFVDDALAAHYELPDRPGDTLTRVSLDPGRATLLAHGSLTSGRTIPLRGAFVAGRIRCQDLPAPPPDIEPTPPAGDGVTERENYEAQLAPACVGCHELFDPFGFALEAFDRDGSFRTMEAGLAIDDGYTERCIGRAFLPAGSGAGSLGQWLAGDAAAHTCFARQWTRYLTRAEPSGCEVAGLAFAPASGQLRDLYAALVTADATRPVEAPREPLGSFTFAPFAGDVRLGAIDAAIGRLDEWRSATTRDEDLAFLDQLGAQWRELRMRLAG